MLCPPYLLYLGRGARVWHGDPGFYNYKVLQGQMEPNDTHALRSCMAAVEQKKLHIWQGAGPPHDMKTLYLENFVLCILISKDSIK